MLTAWPDVHIGPPMVVPRQNASAQLHDLEPTARQDARPELVPRVGRVQLGDRGRGRPARRLRRLGARDAYRHSAPRVCPPDFSWRA